MSTLSKRNVKVSALEALDAWTNVRLDEVQCQLFDRLLLLQEACVAGKIHSAAWMLWTTILPLCNPSCTMRMQYFLNVSHRHRVFVSLDTLSARKLVQTEGVFPIAGSESIPIDTALKCLHNGPSRAAGWLALTCTLR